MESVTFVQGWKIESSQREVVTDSPRRVDFPLTGRRCPCELIAGELRIYSSS